MARNGGGKAAREYAEYDEAGESVCGSRGWRLKFTRGTINEESLAAMPGFLYDNRRRLLLPGGRLHLPDHILELFYLIPVSSPVSPLLGFRCLVVVIRGRTGKLLETC